MMRAIAFLLLSVSIAQAQQPMPGIDHPGLARFCGEALRGHPRGWALGTMSFVDGFGDSLECVRRFCDAKIAPLIRIHAKWRDDHACERPEVIEKEAARIEGTAAHCKARGVAVYISGQCEHNCDSIKAGLHRAKSLAKCPSCAGYVNTPWRGARLDGINETHGANPKNPGGRWMTSFDGESATDADIEKWKRASASSFVRFYWKPENNGRCGKKDKTPRKDRKCWASADVIRSQAYLDQELGGAAVLPRNSLVKSHADNHGPGDVKANKPVLILPIKARRLELFAARTRIESVGLFGSYDGTLGAEDPCRGKREGSADLKQCRRKHPLFRYYMPRMGFQISERARAASGSPIVEIRADGRVIGKANMARRAPFYR